MHPGWRDGEYTVSKFEQVCCCVSLVPVLTHLVSLPNGRLVLLLAVLLSSSYLDGLLEDSDTGICLGTKHSPRTYIENACHSFWYFNRCAGHVLVCTPVWSTLTAAALWIWGCAAVLQLEQLYPVYWTQAGQHVISQRLNHLKPRTWQSIPSQ